MKRFILLFLLTGLLGGTAVAQPPTVTLVVQPFNSFQDLQNNPSLLQLQVVQSFSNPAPLVFQFQMNHNGTQPVAQGVRPGNINGSMQTYLADEFIDFSSLQIEPGYQGQFPPGNYVIDVAVELNPPSTQVGQTNGNFSLAPTLNTQVNVIPFDSKMDVENNPTKIQLTVQQNGIAAFPIDIQFELEHEGNPAWDGQLTAPLPGANKTYMANECIDLPALNVQSGYGAQLPFGNYTVRFSVLPQLPSSMPSVAQTQFQIAAPTLGSSLQVQEFSSFNDLQMNPSLVQLTVTQTGTASLPVRSDFELLHDGNSVATGTRDITLNGGMQTYDAAQFIDFVGLQIQSGYENDLPPGDYTVRVTVNTIPATTPTMSSGMFTIVPVIPTINSGLQVMKFASLAELQADPTRLTLNITQSGTGQVPLTVQFELEHDGRPTASGFREILLVGANGSFDASQFIDFPGLLVQTGYENDFPDGDYIVRITINTMPPSTASVSSGMFTIDPVIPTLTSSLQVMKFTSFTELQSSPNLLDLMISQSGTGKVSLSVLFELEHDGMPAASGTREIALNGASGNFDAAQFIDFGMLQVQTGYENDFPDGNYTVRVTINTIPPSTPSVSSGMFTIDPVIPTLTSSLQVMKFTSFTELQSSPNLLDLMISQSGTGQVSLSVLFELEHDGMPAASGTREIALNGASGNFDAAQFIDFGMLQVQTGYENDFPDGNYTVRVTINTTPPSTPSVSSGMFTIDPTIPTITSSLQVMKFTSFTELQSSPNLLDLMISQSGTGQVSLSVLFELEHDGMPAASGTREIALNGTSTNFDAAQFIDFGVLQVQTGYENDFPDGNYTVRVTINTTPPSTPSVSSGMFTIDPTIPTITSSLQVMKFTSFTELQSSPNLLDLMISQSGTGQVSLSVLFELEHDGMPAASGTREIALNGASGNFDAAQFIDFGMLQVQTGYENDFPDGNYTVRVTINTIPPSTPSVRSGMFTIDPVIPTLTCSLQVMKFTSFTELQSSPNLLDLMISQSGTGQVPVSVLFELEHDGMPAASGTREIALNGTSTNFDAAQFIDFGVLQVQTGYENDFPDGNYTVRVTINTTPPSTPSVSSGMFTIDPTIPTITSSLQVMKFTSFTELQSSPNLLDLMISQSGTGQVPVSVLFELEHDGMPAASGTREITLNGTSTNFDAAQFIDFGVLQVQSGYENDFPDGNYTVRVTINTTPPSTPSVSSGMFTIDPTIPTITSSLQVMKFTSFTELQSSPNLLDLMISQSGTGQVPVSVLFELEHDGMPAASGTREITLNGTSTNFDAAQFIDFGVLQVQSGYENDFPDGNYTVRVTVNTIPPSTPSVSSGVFTLTTETPDLTADLQGMPYPSFEDLQRVPESLLLTIGQNGTTPIDLLLQFQLFHEGAPIANGELPVTLTGATRQFNALEWIDFVTLQIGSGYEGRFPPGTYLVTATITGVAPVIAPIVVTWEFRIEDSGYRAFISLVQPPDEAVLQVEDPVFMWTNSARPAAQESYSLLIVQMLQGQSPAHAIEANVPILEADNLTEQILYYGNDLLPFEAESDYAWRVRDNATGNSSEIRTFKFKPPSDRLRVPVDTPRIPGQRIREPEIIKPPPERVPPDTFKVPVTDKCLPGLETDPTTPISVGMVTEDLATFQYPRAVPIRGAAIDWDLATWSCVDCKKAKSFKQKAVRDDIASYQWTLTGPGSLNAPIDAQKVRDQKKRIAEILRRLEEIDARLAELEDEKSEIPAKLDALKARAQAQLDIVLRRLQDIETELTTLRDSLRTLQGRITRAESDIASAANGLQQAVTAVPGVEAEIERLQDILDGKPDPAELLQLEQLQQLREQHENEETARTEKDEEIHTESDHLNAAIEQARATIAAENQNYVSLKEQAESLTGSIASLQSQLYRVREGRDYLTRRRDWQSKSSAFVYSYLSAQQSTLSAAQVDVDEAAREIFGTRDVATRSSLLATFTTELASFTATLQSGCSGVEPALRSECAAAGREVKDAADAFLTAVTAAAGSSYYMDPQVIAQLASARTALRQAEASLRASIAAIEAANVAYQAALDEYITTMARLENEKSSLGDALAQTETALAEAEQQYQSMVNAREDDLEKSRQQYLDEQQGFALQRLTLLGNIDSLKTRLFELDTTMTGLNYLVTETEATVAELEDEKEKLGKRKAQLEETLQLTAEDLLKPIEEEIALLEDEKGKLESELEDLRNSVAAASAGKKTATGALVYYIPPPLEEIIKDKTTFIALKDSVGAAESNVEKAKAEKAGIQSSLVREITTVSRSLMKSADLKREQSALEEELRQIEQDLASLKNGKASEHMDEQRENQERLADAKIEEEAARQRYQKALSDSARLVQEVEEMKARLEQEKTAVEGLHEALNTLQAQYDKEVDLQRRAAETLENRNEELKQELEKYNAGEEKLSQARNTLARATAAENAAAAGSARAAVQQLEAEMQTLGTAVASARTGVSRASTSLESAGQRVKNAAASLAAKTEELRLKGRQLLALRDDFYELNEEYKSALSAIRHWEEILRDKEGEVANLEENRKTIQDKISEGIDNDEEVQAKEEEKKEKEDAIAKLDEGRTMAKTKAEKSLDEKKELEEKMQRLLQDALDRLEKAKQELRDFLLREFETVTLDATLKVEADDAVIDGYRSNDAKGKLVKVLSYPGQRTPVFDNKLPSNAGPPIDEKQFQCPVGVSFIPPGPIGNTSNSFAGDEPRTIALIYRNGEPLWPEWPVIPAGTPTLSKDVAMLTAHGTDGDGVIHECSGPSVCPGGKYPAGIADVTSYVWDAKDRFYVGHEFRDVFWETPDVDKPLCEEKKEFNTTIKAEFIFADTPVFEKNERNVKPGVLIEVPEEIRGAPEEKAELAPRIVKGDHTGLDGEDVEFNVTLVAGEAEDYGFDGTDTTKTVQTKDGGYAKTEFHFGKGFARFRIDVAWKRDGECDRRSFDAVSPLYHRLARVGAGPTEVVWAEAEKIWEAASIGGFESAADGLAENEEASSGGTGFALAALHDENRDWANDIELAFTAEPDSLQLEPEEAQTKLFGIARTVIGNLPEEGVIEITSEIEERYTDVTEPPEDAKEYNTSGFDRIKIGDPDDLFVIALDETAPRGEPVNGTGSLVVEIPGQLILALKDLSLQLREVELEMGDDEVPTAVSGSVVWEADGSLKKNILGFDLDVKSLGIEAGKGARIDGSVKAPKLEQAVDFIAVLNTSGSFYGDISQLPEVSLAGFTLKEGSSVVIDMHDDMEPPGVAEKFKGIFIRKASLELPAVFNRDDNPEGEETVLTAENFYWSSSGLNGKVGLEGGFLKLGFAGFDVEANTLSGSFDDGALTAFAVGGSMSLPVPFEGTLNIDIENAQESFTAKLSTDDPVTIPRLSTVFSINNAALEWNKSTSVGTVTLAAVISSEKFGEVRIENFKIDSEGEIDAKLSLPNADPIRFGKGFTVTPASIEFARQEGEYALSLGGAIAIPGIGLEKLVGSIDVAPGPTLGVTIEGGKVSFEQGPVAFEGEFNWSGEEFRSEFEVGLKNLAEKGAGIIGAFVAGTQAEDENTSFTYWYVELGYESSKGIPLGSTGTSLLGLGGGVGYNYTPPIGDEPGTPAKRTPPFALKAYVTVGNSPGGELFKGRLTMVLMSGLFALNGKVWLLEREESMYGEGQLNLRWQPQTRLDGHVQMFVGIPDADGDVLRFRGKINYLFNSTSDFSIVSDEISGSFLNALRAEAHLDLRPGYIDMGGRVFYNLDRRYPFGIVDVLVYLDVSAGGRFRYDHKARSLFARTSFRGAWDVNLDTPVGVYDILSGRLVAVLELKANPTFVSVEGGAMVEWQILWYEGREEVEFGFRYDL